MQEQSDLGDRKPAEPIDGEQSATEQAAEGVAKQGAGISEENLRIFYLVIWIFFQFLFG